MTDAAAPDPESLRRQLQRQFRRVLGLRGRVYAQADPSADLPLQQQLAAEEARLNELESQVSALARAHGAGWSLDRTSRAPSWGEDHRPAGRGDLAHEASTHWCLSPARPRDRPAPDRHGRQRVARAEARLRPGLHRRALSRGMAHRRARPAEAGDIPPDPDLVPERARTITEVQRATLHVVALDLDGKTESHDTFSIVCLARTSSFNAVRNPDTGQVVDLSHCYGAWVTPYAEAVQERVRRAADLMPNRQIWGYQDDPESVKSQVEALYRVLKEAEITYINSVIDYGAPPGQAIQRTRLPRESLAVRAANCIDGTVLFASLLEGASLNPAIVLIPGHAFVGWEAWDGSDEWSFLETTMIGSHDFEAACRSGQKQYDRGQDARSRPADHAQADRVAGPRNLAHGVAYFLPPDKLGDCSEVTDAGRAPCPVRYHGRSRCADRIHQARALAGTSRAREDSRCLPR